MINESAIYAIQCPLSYQIVYIGRAVNYLTRFEQHKKCKESFIGRWIRAMYSIGKDPILKIIEMVPSDKAGAVESEWISFYSMIGHANHNVSCNYSKHSALARGDYACYPKADMQKDVIKEKRKLLNHLKWELHRQDFLVNHCNLITLQKIQSLLERGV